PCEALRRLPDLRPRHGAHARRVAARGSRRRQRAHYRGDWNGKELLARHLHACSPRRAEPYLVINCGAISAELMESTFFGYVRGAFSGADPRGRAGYFESARGGTLFLDEVGELPPAMQTSLLRVLEDGSYQRVGSCETLRARCRIVAATHRNLEQL